MTIFERFDKNVLINPDFMIYYSFYILFRINIAFFFIKMSKLALPGVLP